MANAHAHLAGYGVSMGVARDFIMGNISNLDTVFSVCKEFKVTNSMIAEILADDFPGLNGTAVSGFFDSKGFKGSDLDTTSTPTDSSATNIGLGQTLSLLTQKVYTESGRVKDYSYTYDSASGVISRDLGGYIWEYQYDSNGNKTNVQGEYKYDETGTKVANGELETTVNTFDDQGRKTSSTLTVGEMTTLEEKIYNDTDSTITYNIYENGTLVRVGNGTLNEHGLTDTITFVSATDSSFIKTNTFTYNENGNKLTYTYDNTGDGVSDYIATYAYDSNGYLTTFTKDNNADGVVDYTENYSLFG